MVGGAVGGPVGAGIGAGIGALGGWFGGGSGLNREEQARKNYGMGAQGTFGLPGYDQSHGQYSNMANQFAGRRAPQAGVSGFRGDQQALGQQLAREAQGNGIGQQLIRQQAQGQADRGMQQQMAQAASARPGMGALAQRGAAMNSANMNAQVGGQSAQAAGQYQLGAMNQYGGFLQGARGQDDSQAQFNTDARLRQLGLNDTSQLAALQQRLQAQQMQQQGNQEFERQKTQRYGAAMGAPTSGEQFLSGMAGLGTAYLGMKK